MLDSNIMSSDRYQLNSKFEIHTNNNVNDC